MAEKETIILDFQVEQGDAISELEKTKKSIILLKQEQQELNKQYKAGEISLEAYAAEQVKLEGILKKQTNQYNTVQKSVTGVKTQFDKLIDSNKGIQKSLESTSGSIAALVPGFSQVAGGVQTVTTASKAFIATPIGAVIGALALAVGALTRYFNDNEEGQNKWIRVVNIASAVVGKLTDGISKLGGILFDNLAKGFDAVFKFLAKWVPGFDEATMALSNFLNIDRAEFISNLQAETDLLERQLIVQKAVLEAKVAENKLRAEDKSLDLKSRIAALQLASKSQKELNDLQLKFAENRLKIIEETNKQSNSDKEALKQEAEAVAELSRVRKDAADKQKEIFTKLQELTGKEIAARQILLDLDKQIADNLDNNLTKSYEKATQAVIDYINAYDGLTGVFIEVGELQDEAADANAEYAKSVRLANAEIQQQELIQAQALQVGFEFAGQNKGLQSALTLISTYFTAQKAYESQFSPIPTPDSPIRGTIAAALAIASGLKRVADINEIDFGGQAAGGGKFMTKGPTMLLVGDNPGGVERVTVEPVSGRGKTRVSPNGNLIAMAGGGVLETQSITSPINQSFAFRGMMDKIEVVASWKEATELDKRIKFKEALIQI